MNQTSVIIPIGTGKEYIDECLASVSGDIDEIMVMVDGVDFAPKRVLPKHASIYQLSKKGPAQARNQGAHLATKPLLCFCDVDDLWPPGRMQHLVECWRKEQKPTIVFGRYRYFQDEVSPKGMTRRYSPTTYPALLPGGFLISSTLWSQLRGFDPNLRVGEFLEWFDRLKSKNVNVVQIDEVILWRRIHEGQHSRSALRENSYLPALQKILARKPGLFGYSSP